MENERAGVEAPAFLLAGPRAQVRRLPRNVSAEVRPWPLPLPTVQGAPSSPPGHAPEAARHACHTKLHGHGLIRLHAVTPAEAGIYAPVGVSKSR